MPNIKITGEDEQRTLFFEAGSSLREILDVTDIRVRAGCRGVGSCGLCLVLIEEGSVNKATENETLILAQEMLNQGVRLACQVFPRQDISIRIVNTAPKSDWHSIPADAYFIAGNFQFNNNCNSSADASPLTDIPVPDTKQKTAPENPGIPAEPECLNILGLAVDLGTTHISTTLWDMAALKRLAGRTGLNKQLLFGADVMTRLVAATESRERAHEISLLAIQSIGQAIQDICSREGYDSQRIGRVSIVGNTAELALLSENNYGMLLEPKFWSDEIYCQPKDTRAWCGSWNICPDAVVDVVAPLAGFVGSDLLAGIIATGVSGYSQTSIDKNAGIGTNAGFQERLSPVSLATISCDSRASIEKDSRGSIWGNSGVSLFMDFGTNTEISLWDGDTLWVTSAAGGPAFEGSGLGCGMPAAPGAIYQISRIEHGRMLHDADYKVIAGEEPKGFCGSGLVDLIALLLNSGVINTKGKFTYPLTDGSFIIHKSDGHIAVTPRDIDLLQRAKAAIGTGIQCLLSSSGTSIKNLRQIYVCGVFGRFL
ncbi:MAG: DUF4445 domain-containing protein, partial [Desulfamplus sp.]|nr:DUF4445 domain-containing protein [Desulfamplus sp.]